MPFDRLPGHSLKTPTFTPYIPPPRPVIPWASYIVPAVDKIAQSMVYAFSPYEKQMRGAELAKAQVGQMQAGQQMQLAPQTLDLQRREIAMREKQLGFQEKYLNQMGNGNLQPGWVIGVNGMPTYDPAKYKASLAIKQQTDEANSMSNYGAMAEQARKSTGAQPPAPTDDDEAFWLKYHAAAAKYGDGNFGYDNDGNPVPNNDNE